MKKANFRRIALYVISIGVILLMFLMLFRAVPAVLGAGLITLDGAFGDWSGQSCISDPAGDVADLQTDITLLCFATNPGVSNTYFRALRAGGSGAVVYFLYIDTNNNSNFNDPSDKVVTIDYKPTGNGSTVTVSWPGGSVSGDWGESRQEGALNVEWEVPFSAMGISAGQTIQIYLASSYGAGVLDTTGIVQWSPANALGWIMLGVILVGASVWMTFLSRRAARNSGKSSTDR
jgi:hypothetical protein